MSRELPDRHEIERAAGLSFGAPAEEERRPQPRPWYEWVLIASLLALGLYALWLSR